MRFLLNKSIDYNRSIACIILFFTIYPVIACADIDIRDDLKLLRDRCLYYSVGHAPNDKNTTTIRNGLYAQSPFSVPSSEIDIAASGFSLAALPSAVENGLISNSDAYEIAKVASERILEMVRKSAGASTLGAYNKYGYKGMLYHYYVWSQNDNEFQGRAGVEVSSIDTTLLLFGLLVSGNYFEGDVLVNYQRAKGLINWKEWLDTSTPGHGNQFRMSWKDGTFASNWWDWRSEETMLICFLAAASDKDLNIKTLWSAWEKRLNTYNSPPPKSESFTTYATWNGDPFTVFYGLNFLKFRKDVFGINWFSQSEIEYKGHVEFFKKERGYVDHMTFSFSDGSEGAIAEPKINPETPLSRSDCPIYSLVGGLDYYSNDPEENPLAKTISLLVQKDGFFEWTGWPPESVDALNISHDTFNRDIIGQNISAIAIAIDNYLTGRVRRIVMKDPDIKRIYDIIMPEVTPFTTQYVPTTTLLLDNDQERDMPNITK